jgi:hypothetical protein
LYFGKMALFPSRFSPTGTFSDLVAFFRNSTGSRSLIIALVSLAIPAIWILMMLDTRVEVAPKPPRITYIRNLPANVSDAELRKIQIEYQADYDRRKAVADAANAERRRKFKEINDTLKGYGF